MYFFVYCMQFLNLIIWVFLTKWPFPLFFFAYVPKHSFYRKCTGSHLLTEYWSTRICKIHGHMHTLTGASSGLFYHTINENLWSLNLTWINSIRLSAEGANWDIFSMGNNLKKQLSMMLGVSTTVHEQTEMLFTWLFSSSQCTSLPSILVHCLFKAQLTN